MNLVIDSSDKDKSFAKSRQRGTQDTKKIRPIQSPIVLRKDLPSIIAAMATALKQQLAN